MLDDTLQLLEPQLRRSQIEIVRDYDDELPLVLGNSVKLQQVFTNSDSQRSRFNRQRRWPDHAGDA